MYNFPSIRHQRWFSQEGGSLQVSFFSRNEKKPMYTEAQNYWGLQVLIYDPDLSLFNFWEQGN